MLQTIPAEPPSSVPGASIPAPNAKDPPLNENNSKVNTFAVSGLCIGQSPTLTYTYYVIYAFLIPSNINTGDPHLVQFLGPGKNHMM